MKVLSLAAVFFFLLPCTRARAQQTMDIGASSDRMELISLAWYESPIVWAGFGLLLVAIVIIAVKRTKYVT